MRPPPCGKEFYMMKPLKITIIVNIFCEDVLKVTIKMREKTFFRLPHLHCRLRAPLDNLMQKQISSARKSIVGDFSLNESNVSISKYLDEASEEHLLGVTFISEVEMTTITASRLGSFGPSTAKLTGVFDIIRQHNKSDRLLGCHKNRKRGLDYRIPKFSELPSSLAVLPLLRSFTKRNGEEYYGELLIHKI
ncbi:hypothetical protein EGR_07083 [Echinococcus granulosus]|uniref:Uncharacterized protein n=1 Tax=Echinococcus granulosus TaxID=6210 RepID=W6U9L3_ECHGR|nr:hypothetical protein EGR_07083 [Echinococcus granulosus]EUB58063.1 hypothetical protein EGR_07083 [Echinococcus granulosus]